MVQFDSLSSVGFGGYRIDVRDNSHRRALEYALSLGCNVVDTATTYSNGRSEVLIGECEKRCSKEVFVISKCGYVQGPVFAALRQVGLGGGELKQLSEDSWYSIHPDVICCQLEITLARLERGWVDGYLLHNPERMLSENGRGEELYSEIGAAFVCLEECVDEGKIRYYGVSSDALVKDGKLESGRLSLERLVDAAERVSNQHHFRIIQFPFNLLERGALDREDDGRDLFQRAKSLGLLCLVNRPLNALYHGGVVRLASYLENGGGPEDVDRQWERCQLAIKERLGAIGMDRSLTSIPGLGEWDQLWRSCDTAESVQFLFAEVLLPSLMSIFGSIPQSTRMLFDDLYRSGEKYVRRRQAERARYALAKENVSYDDSKLLQVAACEECLEAGGDCVLVGMRSRQYVDHLAPLIRRARVDRSS